MICSPAITVATSLLALTFSSAVMADISVSDGEISAIAKEAYVYGYPVVEMYKTLYAQAVDQGGPDYKASFNQIGNAARVFSPQDKAFVTPIRTRPTPSCGWTCAPNPWC